MIPFEAETIYRHIFVFYYLNFVFIRRYNKNIFNSMMPSVSYSQNITSLVVELFADWIY